LKARLLVGLAGVPALLGVLWAGFPFLTILVGLVALWGLREFYSLARGTGARVSLTLGAIWTALFVASGQLTAQEGNLAPHLIGGGLLVTLVWTALTARSSKGGFLQSWLFTSAGPLYVGLLLSHALMLREAGDGLYDGRNWLLYALLVTFATDTGAFFTGKALGRHKMVPAISPGKTWEGAVGGLVWAVAASVTLAALLDLSMSVGWQVSLGLILGVAAQLGDLTESLLKRKAGVKDAGALLPGHGGLLDRMDSLVVTLPVTYYLISLIID
jgi:phosphatidate cytidylyltransferase